jgi:hypothetical protein
MYRVVTFAGVAEGSDLLPLAFARAKKNGAPTKRTVKP